LLAYTYDGSPFQIGFCAPSESVFLKPFIVVRSVSATLSAYVDNFVNNVAPDWVQPWAGLCADIPPSLLTSKFEVPVV
jgi:hypothetical protein